MVRAYLCTVCKGHWTLARRIESTEEEDEERNQRQTSTTVLRNPEAESSGEQCPSHVGEGEQQKTSSTERVDCPNCREGEREVDKSKTERGPECVVCSETDIDEDRGRVERDDVDSAPGERMLATGQWRIDDGARTFAEPT